MSLTSALDNPKSSISQWMKAHVDPKAAKDIAKEINDTLAAHDPLIIEGTDLGVVGTAFDYGFRWLTGPLVVERLFAMAGASNASSHEWERLMPSVLTQLVEDGNLSPNLQKRAQATIILAWCESCARQRKYVPLALRTVFPPDLYDIYSTEFGPELDIDEFGDPIVFPFDIDELGNPIFPPDETTPGFEGAVDSAEVRTTIGKLYAQIPPQTLQDVMQLLETVPSVWGDDLKQPFILNPTFEGSPDVGGADADWIAGNVLYECKCKKETRPFDRPTLLQLLAYVLLDYSDRYAIDGVGWYFARQQVRVRYPLREFVNRVCGTSDLSSLRASLAAALHGQKQNKKSN